MLGQTVIETMHIVPLSQTPAYQRSNMLQP